MWLCLIIKIKVIFILPFSLEHLVLLLLFYIISNSRLISCPSLSSHLSDYLSCILPLAYCAASLWVFNPWVSSPCVLILDVTASVTALGISLCVASGVFYVPVLSPGPVSWLVLMICLPSLTDLSVLCSWFCYCEYCQFCQPNHWTVFLVEGCQYL